MDSAKLGILIAMLFFHDSSILVRSALRLFFRYLEPLYFYDLSRNYLSIIN